MLFAALRDRFFVNAGRRCKKAPRAFKPMLEPLECRTVPAALKFMTYNAYQGTDHAHILAALQQNTDLPTAVSQDFADVVSSDIPDRALGIAHVILQSHADVVGLQEVTSYAVNGTIRYDILHSVLADLNAHGEHYKLVQVAPAFTITLPDASGDFITEADQNAILVRVGHGDDQILVSHAQAGTFAAHATITIGSFSVPFTRSWAEADFTVHGDTVHFVTAHLESLDPRLADAQAQELLAGPAQSSLPVVVAGDFNAPADGSPAGTAYSDFANPTTGFVDAWQASHRHAPGYTWGPLADPRDPSHPLTERIDFIFVHGGAHVLQTSEAGIKRHDRKPGGVWPSDHAAVISLVRF